MKSVVSILKQTDYRAFLVAHAQEAQRANPRWTYGAWAKRLGLKTTSSITKIIQGKREPGEQISEALCDYFKFNDKERRYFRDLVRLQKIRKDPRLSTLLMEKMEKEFPNGVIRTLDDKTFTVISHWFCLPIRELARRPGFIEDADQISKQFKFKITAREVKQAIESLIQIGLLKRDERGRLTVGEGRIHTTNDLASEGIKRFHEQMLDHAKTSVRTIGVEEREMTGSCLVIRTSNLAQAKEMIREFRSKFARTFEEEKGDALYQIQIQFFPLTERLANEGEVENEKIH